MSNALAPTPPSLDEIARQLVVLLEDLNALARELDDDDVDDEIAEATRRFEALQASVIDHCRARFAHVSSREVAAAVAAGYTLDAMMVRLMRSTLPPAPNRPTLALVAGDAA